MVRLNSVQAKALHRLQSQAGVQQPPKYEWPKLGKPVYLYVAQNLLCSTKTASQQI